ncbi:hypothetical protein OG500_02480 [Kitasatospora sp. NBC_01250]|uniref:hypothetical protein n=1 Tax=Kitasatospora sp. NBC_01250 TaxID=2903571 RepID=UPI002E30C7EC|nr:hypothetical protein [Kitasatospora sp. NBC_01250]
MTDPQYPIIVLDDDQWLDSCRSDDELQRLVEPDFLDEDVAGAFDALARPLRLTVHDGRIVPQVDGPADPGRLQEETEKFFHRWTYVQAPPRTEDLARYLAEVTVLARTTRSRRRGRDS